MPDLDLRRRALESGKTTSRKAQAKSQQSSRASSRANSRAASRVASRDVSDDEDERNGNLSDDTNMRYGLGVRGLGLLLMSDSIHSIDQLLESDEFQETNTEALKDTLNNTIAEILERKGSSSEGREGAYVTYDRILSSHHFGDILYGKVDDVLAALSKSIKTETTSRETIFALRGVALTGISYEDSNLYETVGTLVKKTVSDSQDNPTKAAAIYCLGICLSFGGAGDDEIAETCEFLLEIVQSDGAFIGADDSSEVVTAALQTYSFLTTQLENVEATSEDAVEAFLEQLNSGDANVQIAAGEAIALLFEKSYGPREDDDDEYDNDEEDGDADSDDVAGDTSLVKRYNAYHNPAEVLEKVTNLANVSSKGINRNDRKRIHQSFSSIAMTVENPRNGLRTNNASKTTVRIHREGEIKVDKWWKLMRLNALRRVLAGGFVNHYFEGNKQVLNALPVIVRITGGAGGLSPRRTPRKAGDKYRDARRFVSADIA